MKITEQEFEYFSKLLTQKFELNKHKNFDTAVNDLENILGQQLLIQTKIKDVNRTKFRDLNNNKIVFYARTKKKRCVLLGKTFQKLRFT